MGAPGILVVDDNAVNAKLLSFVLARAGYPVRVAGNAAEALAALDEFAPHLVLMDLQMPGMDGLALTRRLRADPKWRSLIIIAVTAYAMVGDRERALEAGCDDYVTKPIDTRTLPARIVQFLGQGRAGSIEAE
jgi:CheY-like chemotaxis protein